MLIARFVGSVIPHPETVSHWPELYKTDGVHLSELVMGLSLKNLQGALKLRILAWVAGLDI